YTLSEARMAADAARAAKAAASASGPGDAAGPPPDFGAVLREVIDEPSYPRLYRIAWDPGGGPPPTEDEQFLFGVDVILDGVQALIERAG
ncbi:MAG TPA: hypothetical protein VFE59_28740, partial [Trebonia sp.]|nr:hypothetical protein [Trebonia sp.]